MKILVVEDQRRLGVLLKQGLTEAGYTVGHVNSCSAARDALCESSYGAIVLDLGLPDGDGLDLRHAKQIVETIGRGYRINLAHFFPTYHIHIANCFQAAQLVEIADQISAPVAATHNSHPRNLPIHDRVPLFHRLVGVQAQPRRQLPITTVLVFFQIEFSDGVNYRILLRLC